MKDLLEKNNLLKPPKIGDIVEGEVIGRGKMSLFLNLGNFKTGIIYGREYLNSKEEIKNLKIGDKIFVKIIDLDNEDGFVEVSLAQAGQELAWQNLKNKKEKDEIIEIKVLGANKGGLLTEIDGIPAFLPVSQLSQENYPKIEGEIGEEESGAIILKKLQKFIGKKMEVKILDFSPKERKVILSEKAKNSEKIKEIIQKYKIGEVLEGEITAILDFGAFVRLEQKEPSPEPIEGLIHISELDWQLIQDPSQVVKIGEKVKVKIIDISNNKISLSLKALKKNPWEEIEKKYKEGDIVRGKVTKFNPFGAFVQLTSLEDLPIQGLIHISEFGTKSKMLESLKEGNEYDFQISLIDPKEYRLILKLPKQPQF
jgi:small subunit ribosomal protein S1